MNDPPLVITRLSLNMNHPGSWHHSGKDDRSYTKTVTLLLATSMFQHYSPFYVTMFNHNKSPWQLASFGKTGASPTPPWHTKSAVGYTVTLLLATSMFMSRSPFYVETQITLVRWGCWWRRLRPLALTLRARAGGLGANIPGQSFAFSSLRFLTVSDSDALSPLSRWISLSASRLAVSFRV